MSQPDPRRRVPRTDVVLSDPRLKAATDRVGASTVRSVVRAAQDLARTGTIARDQVADHAYAALPARATTLRPVLNATGVVLHTNLGRAPLSPAAVEAVTVAAGYVDVEYDLATGRRARRGRGALAALRAALPGAEDMHVVNNGAAALVLAATALAASKEIVVSRGEMVEIGDGFRLPDLLACTGARIHEVGTTNRTTRQDYASAIGSETGIILKVHPSNFRITGFTSSVPVGALADLAVPVVVDVGSGLLQADPLLPDEPDVAGALREGASVVTASTDKLLGGPQGGLLAGDQAIIERLRRHPLARALRVDKLTIAALEATLLGAATSTYAAIHADPAELRVRAERLADRVGGKVVASGGAVGGGGAPGRLLAGWGVALPESCAAALRTGEPCVVARIAHGHTVIDLRCIAAEEEAALAAAVLAVVAAG